MAIRGSQAPTSKQALGQAPPIRRARRRRSIVLVVGVLAAAVAATTLVQLGVVALPRSAASVPVASPPPPSTPPTLTLAFSGPVTDVPPAAPIGVTVTHGTLTALTVAPLAGGAAVAGRLQHGAWMPLAPLAWATTYRVVATASASSRGQHPAPVTVVRTFTTPPAPLAMLSLIPNVSPYNGEPVGEGAVFVLQFPRAIPAAGQAEILQALHVSMSIPEVGRWRWFSPTELHFRPEHFWPVGERVTLEGDLNGLQLIGHRLVNSQFTSSFTVVDDHLTVISAITHRELVYNHGRLIQNFPVSLGRPGFRTISGTLIVLSKSPSVFMNSATIGYPGLYAQNVYYDVAVSTDGYYIHDASWDVYDHGVANVSHGCVEQNPADAVWFYNFSIPGDVVEISGTGLPAGEVNGEADWNIPWAQY
ncbi:MAG TPA: Ig-like domain-containing protein [Verrucomicrobiae bacterium]|nr:Ig-like domain-containing protein [Verrucomicrobiae bacterium]